MTSIMNGRKPTGIVIIDPQVDKLECIVESALPGMQAVVLNPHKDGILQITRVLAKYKNIDSLHIISHGSPGLLGLGSTLIDIEKLSLYREHIIEWTHHLKERASIVLYGCSLAAGRAGQEFLQSLIDWTGANIAASSVPVGHPLQGGSWDFDYRAPHSFTPDIVFKPEFFESYSFVFQNIRINAGGGSYTDSQGQVWQADTYFTGGSIYSTSNAIAGTDKDSLFQSERYGNFSYAIPVTNGVYDVNLLFSEIYFNDPNQRIFDVKVEGQSLIDNLDLVATGGANAAILQALNNIQVSDGELNLEFVTEVNNAKLSAIEVLPDGVTSVTPGVSISQSGGNAAVTEGGATDTYNVVLNTQPTSDVTITINSGTQTTTTPTSLTFTSTNWNVAQTVAVSAVDDTTVEGNHSGTITHTVSSSDANYNNLSVTSVGVSITDNDSNNGGGGTNTTAIRINAGGGSYTDSQGQVWQADTYFTGGATYSVSGSTEIFKTDADPLYQSERYGNFSYDIPITNGNYAVKLHFAEIYHDNFNERVFDVLLENSLTVDDLDIFARSKNAFFPGNNSALVVSIPQVDVTDGKLDLDFVTSIDQAKLSAIEIIPLAGPQIFLQQTSDKTVMEGISAGSDSYSIVLNTKPTADVTIGLTTNNTELTIDSPTSLTFTPDNWNVPQTVSFRAVDDNNAEGTHFVNISHIVTSPDSNYNNFSLPPVSVTIKDNDVVPIQFTTQTVATNVDTGSGFQGATTAEWGPDGRLYVGTYTGQIKVYTFNDDYQVVNVQEINVLTNVSNNNILGIAFNPYDTVPKIYVSHSQLYANGGGAFPATQLSPYSGQVSILEGPDFTTVTPLITGLPVSNHDHGVNGLQFDNNGDLYIAIGGNTNAGISNSNIGGLPESPFSAAILKATISDPNFNGNIEYSLPGNFVPPAGWNSSLDPADSQTWGDIATVNPGVGVSVYASGLRNPYDLVFTTSGNLYATENGPNAGFGDVSTSAATQQPFTQSVPDELNLIVGGQYYGHPNRNRGVTDDRQNVYNSSLTNEPGYTAPIATSTASTNGLTEYRATAFGGGLRGNLLAQDWNDSLYSFTLSADGTQVIKQETFNFTSGLDVLTGPGGAIVGIDLIDNSIDVALPNDLAVTTNLAAYDIFPWRAPVIGGQKFVIGGANFTDLINTTVTIGSQTATLTRVSANRIEGIFPSFSPTNDNLLDIVITSGNQTSTIIDAFHPLFI
jgi:glucose/arabinose dehydrogenase